MKKKIKNKIKKTEREKGGKKKTDVNKTQNGTKKVKQKKRRKGESTRQRRKAYLFSNSKQHEQNKQHKTGNIRLNCAIKLRRVILITVFASSSR